MERAEFTKLMNRGIALQQQGNLDEAAKIYARLSQVDPDDPMVLNLIGTILIEKRQFSDARRAIERAATLQPNRAMFQHNLATLLAIAGEMDKAEAAYRRAIDLDPGYVEAYFNLVDKLRIRPGDPVIEGIESLLARNDLSEQDRIYLHFAAGKMYADLGDDDRAFEQYRTANDLKFDSLPPDDRETFPPANEALVEGFFARREGWGVADRTPIFVIGMPRSGTTLAEQMLARHSQVAAAGELPDIGAIAKAIGEHSQSKRGWPDCAAELRRPVFEGFARSYLERLRALGSGAAHTVDKMPFNFRHVGLIHLMFPEAPIIHCRRDPVDTCLSCYFQNFRSGHRFTSNLETLADYYADYRALMAHWHRALPGRIYDLDYEKLVAGPEAELRALLDHCGLAWEDACLSPGEARTPVTTASMWQVRQPLYTTSVARWKRYEAHLKPLIARLDERLGRA